jgi:flagellin
MDNITLSGPVRTSLKSSQHIAEQQARTQERLATGIKHSTPRDNAQAYAIATSLIDRAGDLQRVKDTIGQGVSAVGTAVNGLDTIDQLLQQAKAVALQYESTTDPTEQAALSAQFNELANQVDGVARDSSYGGTNLIAGAPETLAVPVNEDGSSAVTVNGVASDSTALGLTLSSTSVDTAINTVRATGAAIGASASALSIREQFNTELVNNLEAGAAKLVNADLNEEAANAISLQTKGLLAVTATGIAAKSEQSVLQLF